jgi:hypothetical protein
MTQLLRIAPLALISVLAACTTDVGSDESNLTASTSRTKTLTSPVAVPTGTAIGTSLASTVASITAGYKASTPKTLTDVPKPGVTITATIQHFTKTGEKGYYQRETQPTVKAGSSTYKGIDVLRFYDGSSTMPVMVWADHDVDGRIDSLRDDRKGTHSLHDDNYDGKVDRWIEAIENLPGFKVEGYGDGWLPPKVLANRILEDTNFDGYFDQESVTGSASAGDAGWWTKP